MDQITPDMIAGPVFIWLLCWALSLAQKKD